MDFVKSLSMFHLDAKEIPCVTGEGTPTEKTEGAPGVLYMDTLTGALYKCRAADYVNKVFAWEAVEGGKTPATVTDRGKRPNRKMVSFMDDDCRAEVVSKLENLIDQKQVPYTLACAPGDIIDTAKTGFISVADLQRMVGKGVSVSCHAWKQYNMDNTDQYPNVDALREDLEKCQAQFDAWGIPVETMSYPQGRTVDAYMPAVREHYRAGFTVSNGINEIPYASYYLDRVGMFIDDEASDGTASLENAKAWVDKLAARESGWLIFMTHAWYKGFKPALLGELIDYIRSEEIRSKGVEIVDIHEALDTTGNVIETGTFKKPSEELTEPFFVLDATGVAHTNALTEYTRKLYELTEMQVGWREGNWYLHGEKGTLLSHTTDTSRRVSVDIPVSAGEKYRISCSSIWSGAAYAVLTATDEAGNRAVVDIKAGTTNTPYTIVDREITIPEGGAILRLSANLAHQPEGYKISRVEPVGTDIIPGENAPTLDAPDGTSSYILPIAGENLGGVKNGGNVLVNADGTMDAPNHLGIAGATVGQIARITAVDDKGVPTAWEAVDEPKTPHIGENGNWWIGETDTGVNASEEQWELLIDVTTETETQIYEHNFEDTPMKKLLVILDTLAADADASHCPVTVSFNNEAGSSYKPNVMAYPLAVPRKSAHQSVYEISTFYMEDTPAVDISALVGGSIHGKENTKHFWHFENLAEQYFHSRMVPEICRWKQGTYETFAPGTRYRIYGVRA